MRLSAIALAIPLAAFGFACRTSSTQGSGRTASASADQGGTEAHAQAGTSDTGAGAAGQASAQAPAAPGDVKAHADDQVVTGKLAAVSSDSITIATDQGDQRTLQVVPQTTVTVDGRDAQAGDLQEGQPVRASFNDVNGEPVAVQVRAGQGAVGERTVEDPGTYVTTPDVPNVPGAGGHNEGGGGGQQTGTPTQPLDPGASDQRR